MNIPDLTEVREKERRVRDYLERSGHDAVIIGRLDNFAWFTCGGDNKVLNTTEIGFTILVIMKQKTYVISHIMDGPRVFDEELYGTDIEPVLLRWYEPSREEKAAEMVKGLKCVSDIHINDTVYSPSEIYKLHYPLTEKEIDKCRWIGCKTEEIIRKVADEVKPGMVEYEIEAMLQYEYTKCNMTLDALMVGSDDRITKFRHPIPSDKKVEKLLLIHPSARKWGLHANITRMVYFDGNLPDELSERYNAACKIEVATISMCVTGEKFCRILEMQKQIYKENGFEDEWRNHFQGAVTGYLLAEPNLCKNPDAKVSVNQAFDWFVTITGVKVEELSVNTSKGREVLSSTGMWPVKEYCYNGQTFKLPQILLK